jgi:hypothetical protein
MIPGQFHIKVLHIHTQEKCSLKIPFKFHIEHVDKTTVQKKMGGYNTRLISQNTAKLFFILYYMYSKKATTRFGLF